MKTLSVEVKRISFEIDVRVEYTESKKVIANI